ncbi:hypothetical protein [Streptomyces echinatus]|uniref:hypothetical protein n=1 Tax=Streptomyces echinatus TaxID=67293 RepID=UPI00379894B9
MDADDAMAVDPDFRMPELTLDAYRVDVSSGPARYRRRALVSTRLPWRYVGVLHEYCASPTSPSRRSRPTTAGRAWGAGTRRSTAPACSPHAWPKGWAGRRPR